MDLATRYINFMQAMYEATGDSSIQTVACKFRALCESNNFRPLLVPDSIHQTAAIDWKGMTHIVPSAPGTSGTSAPDMVSSGPTVVNGHCSRDIGEETKEAKWGVPGLTKNGHIAGLAAQSTVQSVPTDELIKNARKNLPNPMQWTAVQSQMPMQCGYSITCPNNQNGVYAGDGVGGGSSGTGASQ